MNFSKKKNMNIIKKQLPYLILAIVAVGFLFYWYEWRPSQAKKECYYKTYDNTLDISAFGQKASNDQEKENEARYKNCLKEKNTHSQKREKKKKK